MNNNEPVILGKVKKGAAGKPLVVIIIFLFIGAFILFLPTIISYFGDYNIVELIKNGEIFDFFINHENYVNKPIINNRVEIIKDEPLLINSKTVLIKDSITLDNFKLTNDNISFKITNKNSVNIDELNYYLILIQNEKEISTIKLIDSKNQDFQFDFKEKLSTTVEVKGIIKQMKENDYPKFIVSSDESGLGSLVCEKDNYKIEYILNNNNLIKIKETLNYIDYGEDYLTTFEEYNRIVTNINNSNSIATITENLEGFIFTTDIDLSTYTNSYKNNNYYSLNTKTNIINFEMNAKGYDCK